MRLLFATQHAFPPQRVGGSEFSTHDLCRALLRHGVDVGVLAKIEPHGSLHLRNRLARRVLGREASRDKSQGYPVFRACNPVRAVAETLQRFPADVTVLHPDKGSALLEALRAARQPTLVYLRDAEFQRLGFRPTTSFGVGFAANSQFVAQAAAHAFGVTATVIPPLILPERYLTGVTGDEVLFINPVPEKGVELAFEIAALCPQRRFRFVEGWPLDANRRRAITARASELGNVVLQPSTQDMRPIYARTRVLLVPSRWQEAWGRIVTEAQLNGIPVLATRIGGLPESVGDGGELFDPDAGPAAWSAAIERLYANPAHLAAAQARALARSAAADLSAEVLVGRLLEAVARLKP